MAANIEQANALLKEYADLVKEQQGEILTLHNEIKKLKETIQELSFDLTCEMNKEYDV